MPMFTIIGANKSISETMQTSMDIENGMLISDAIRKAGMPFSMPCGGRGTCGKCAVWVRGAVSAADEKEQAKLLSLQHATLPQEGFSLRTACLCRIQGDCTVLLQEGGLSAIQAQGIGELPSYDENEPALGMAIDVGTTTIALRLYDLAQGMLLAEVSGLNAQGAYGADVLSRISYANEHGHQVLHEAITRQLSAMMQAALDKASADATLVRRVVITGNTTMLHFVAGLDPQGIGVAPFIPQSLFGEETRADRLFLLLPAECMLYLPRCISAYVGADIVCGMLALRLCDEPGARLLLDVGTNGEMVLHTGEETLCCATAAGPVFEGAHISMGMGAQEGAICKVRTEDGQITYETIGNAKPIGLCGTGLVSAVRALLETEDIDPTGAIEKDTLWIGDSGIGLSGRDVRELQMAKAAIAAGVETLLHTANLMPEDADCIFLAGGMGSAMDAEDAVHIGLLPECCLQRTQAVGNVALTGAAAMLFSREHRACAKASAERTEEVQLSASAYFQDKYIETMMFPGE